jgi:hypothetical protein
MAAEIQLLARGYWLNAASAAAAPETLGLPGMLRVRASRFDRESCMTDTRLG